MLGTEGPVDLELVERIEIVRGASSSLYGSNAFLGVIDIVTRRGRDVDGVEAAGLAGTRATCRGRLTAGERLAAGAEAQADVHNRLENGDRQFEGNAQMAYARSFLSTETTRYWALVAQAEWQMAEQWSATIGVRRDDYSTFGGVTDPRLALVYRPTEAVTLKALYGQAFRAPNAYELFDNDGGLSQRANPDLAPERIRTSELLAEWRFAPQWRAVGAQLGDVVVTTPRTQVKARLAQSLLGERATVALETISQMRRRTLAGTTIPAQALTNLVGALVRAGGGLRAVAAVTNLFDVTLADPGGAGHAVERIPQPGRGFWIQLEYTLR